MSATASESPALLRDAAIELAREAGALILEGFGRTPAAERKSRIELVTEYDRRSEALLLERIGRRFPGHAVLGEETGAHAGKAPVRWLVDPLDGTTNFAHDYPFFCVSIGVEVAGEMAAGAVYDPVRDELFAAARGAGATLNGRPIRVSEVDRLEDALLVTGFPYSVREEPEQILRYFRAFLVRAQGIRRDGSAALNACYLAMGRFDGFWEPDLSPWDMAAGALIAAEAGARLTRYDGSTLQIEGRQILGANPRLYPLMREVIAACDAGREPAG